ncbi:MULTISPECIES: SusC/RagA family TonB-linked outer membrane protein [Flavobacteriaceae]|uniref:SusC/RagA family TonB-linked outer membrane protein n=2 Tax=Flavobacteriaceae TaxID=49546 RepID=A0A4Y8AU71_9FLAO|nr:MULTISPECIES: SusC/RagA family TonB-linked outer membrane protein [Flavobacteriaceae]TEW74920.1 SusC/RagA family TonB-linked outer membrane protein [Gramella jeungdoensis]GGK43063.1 SusC/RagA family TonB-linked outer membrane protein [Lutibacter litoralis]
MKKLITLLILVFSLVNTHLVKAQVKTISGTVTAASDETPLPGVNVLIQGTTRGSQTNFDGYYTIEASKGDVLIFSFIGMESKSVTIGDEITINVILSDDAQSLDEVIITALGMKKEKKALTYSAQEVKGEDLTRVKQTNPINSLSGKSAGITITKSASGAGGASKVVLRGNSSTTNNDPLYVIDGIPMSNSGNGQNGEEPGTSIFGGHIGNRDGGDTMSLINPDDIESMSVLKGASAAALYGSQGANGVILITTKSGKDGKVSVNFSSNITVDNVTSLPKLQTEYQSNSVGQRITENGNVTDPKSWGAKTSGLSNNVDDFFQTGYTAIQSLSLTAGNKKAQTYFSYANTSAGGIIPNNKLIRNNFNLRETANFLNEKIKVSASINLSDQRINNRPTNGLYSNPITGLYLHPVGIDLNSYKNYEYFNSSTNMMDQYATSFDENIQQNPYWLVNKNPSKDIAQRVLASASVQFQINENISLQSRGSFDKSFFTFDKRMYAGSDRTFVPATGRYILEKTENTQQYIDLIATYNKDLSENFSFSGVLGTSLTKSSIGDRISLDSGNGKGLTYPNVFTIGNFADTNSILQSVFNKEVQSVFGSANFSYKNLLFLDVTGRNDWSSTLVNTNSESFFYPSFGLTGVLSDMFELPEAISFAKIRASYAIVGKDIPTYATVPLNSIPVEQGNFTKPTFGVKEGETLEPEKQNSFEIGTEWRFFHNRLGVDLTYYNTKTTNQIFFIAAEPNVQGYTQNIVNAGEISNSGIELVLNGRPIENDNFKWNTAINFAQNSNKVIAVHPSLQNGEAIITAPGVNGYAYSLIEGEDFGSIRGRSIQRDSNGTPIVSDDSGNLTLESTDFETIAHAQPDFTLGWNNSFDYKNFTINFLVDAKIGGDVVSVTEAINDFYGVSQATADARNINNGMIDVVDSNGMAKKMTAQDYYLQSGGRAGLFGEYVYSATNVSLREVSVGYNLKFEEKFIENLKFSLIANNLFFIYKDAPFDPNIASSTGIGLQGVDIYGQPSTRSIGLNINVNF